MQVEKMFVTLGADISDFAKGMNDAKRTLDSTATEFRNIGVTLSAAFTLPLAAIAKFSIEASAGFEQALDKVRALADDGKKSTQVFDAEISKLSTQALQLGKDTQFSAKQVVDAMGELAASGFTTTAIYESMNGVVSLAAAGQMQLAEAAQISAAVMGGFGIEAGSLVQVADMLAKTASVSAASVQDLGNSFKYIGPIARAAGLSMLDVSTALAALANAGIKGESAGTALRNMVQDLLKPSVEAEKIISNLKVKIQDASGAMLPLAEIIGQFAEKNLTLSQGFQIWGARFSDVLPLLQMGKEKFEALRDEVGKFDGSAKKMSDTLRGNLKGMWEEFSGSVETLGITIGGILQPAVEPMLKWITKLANAAIDLAKDFDKLPASVKMMAGAFTGLMAVVGPAALGVAGVSTALSGISSVASLAMRGLSDVATGAASLMSGIRGIPEAISSINTAIKGNMLGALTGMEKGLLAVGIAASAMIGWEIGTWLYNNVDAAKAFGDSLGYLITKIPGVQRLVDSLSGLTGANKLASDVTKNLTDHLAKQGVVIERGNLSLEEYNKKLREAVVHAKASEAANPFGNQAVAMSRINDLQTMAVGIAQKWSDKTKLVGLSTQEVKSAQFEINNVIKLTQDAQARLNDAVKKGLISKKDAIADEKKLKEALDLATGTLKGMKSAGDSVGVSFKGIHDAGKDAAAQVAGLKARLAEMGDSITKGGMSWEEYKKKLGDAIKAHEGIEQAAKKFQDVVRDLPTNFYAFSQSVEGSGEKAKVVLEKLKEQASDLRVKFGEKLDVGITTEKARIELKTLNFVMEESKKKYGEFVEKVKEQEIEQAFIKAKTAMENAFSTDALKIATANLKELGISLDEFGTRFTGMEAFKTDIEALAPAFKELGMEIGDAFSRMNDLTPLQNMAAKARAAYISIRDSAITTFGEKRDALIKYLGIEADAYMKASTGMRTEYAESIEKIVEAFGSGQQRMVAMAKTAWAHFRDGVSTMFDGFFSTLVDTGDIKQALNAFKQEFINIVLEPLKQSFTRLITDTILGKLGASTSLAQAALGAGQSAGAAVEAANKAALAATKAAEAATSAASTAATAVKATTNAAGAAEQAATATQAASSSISSSIGSVMTNFVAPISSAISAVTGVLSFLQGRRMEQDVGRIEVTTRGVLNQSISIQETLNEYFPQFRDLLTWVVKGNNASGLADSFASALDPVFKILVVATGAIEATRDAVQKLAQDGGGSGLGAALQSLSDQIAELMKAASSASKPIEDITETLEDLADGATDATTELGNSLGQFGKASETAAETLDDATDATVDLGNSIKQFNKINTQAEAIAATVATTTKEVVDVQKDLVATEKLVTATSQAAEKATTGSTAATTRATASTQEATSATLTHVQAINQVPPAAQQAATAVNTAAQAVQQVGAFFNATAGESGKLVFAAGQLGNVYRDQVTPATQKLTAQNYEVVYATEQARAVMEKLGVQATTTAADVQKVGASVENLATKTEPVVETINEYANAVTATGWAAGTASGKLYETATAIASVAGTVGTAIEQIATEALTAVANMQGTSKTPIPKTLSTTGIELPGARAGVTKGALPLFGGTTAKGSGKISIDTGIDPFNPPPVTTGFAPEQIKGVTSGGGLFASTEVGANASSVEAIRARMEGITASMEKLRFEADLKAKEAMDAQAQITAEIQTALTQVTNSMTALQGQLAAAQSLQAKDKLNMQITDLKFRQQELTGRLQEVTAGSAGKLSTIDQKRNSDLALLQQQMESEKANLAYAQQGGWFPTSLSEIYGAAGLSTPTMQTPTTPFGASAGMMQLENAAANVEPGDSITINVDVENADAMEIAQQIADQQRRLGR